jgi:hypothetical protein
MVIREGGTVVLALEATRTSAVKMVAPPCMSRLPTMERHCRDRGWSATKSEEKKLVCEMLSRMDFPPRVREAMQLKTT